MSQNFVVACPNCATRFSAPVGHFLPDGRQVRCSKCRHVWFHAAPTRRDRINPPRIVPSPAVALPSTPMDDEQGLSSATKPADAMPPPAFQPDPEPKHRHDPNPRRGGGALAWSLWAIALLLLLAILAYAFHGPLRKAIPQVAPWLDRYVGTVDRTAQGLTGHTVERTPFKWENIHYDVKEYDGDKEILVEADLVNIGLTEMPAPKVRVRVVDADSAPLHASVIGPEDMSESIAAGATMRYFVRISEPPAEFEAVLLNVEPE